MRVRQRDVARAAGVSQAAVSLVVSGRASGGGVSAGTQERIRAAMDDLGYVPDPVARSLRGGRSGLFGVFTYEPVFPSWPEDYFHDFLVGIEMAASERGRDLVLFSSAQSDDGRRSIYAQGANRLRVADGSIVLGLHRDEHELRRLTEEEYPVVSLGRYDPVPEAAWVRVDYDRAVRAIVDDLHRAGHRSIVYVAGEGDGLPAVARREAFAAATAGDATATVLDAELDVELARSWKDGGVTCVVAESPEAAESLSLVLARAGMRVPDDFSAVSLEVPKRLGKAAGWSHLVIPKRDVGARTVGVLDGILEGRLPRDHHEVALCLPHHLGSIGDVES